MKLSSKLILALSFSGLTTIAQADSLSLGLIGEIDQSPYMGVDHDNNVKPYINYESPYFYIDGLEAGFYLHQSAMQQLTLGVLYDETGFKPKHSDNWQMKQLDRRKYSAMATLDYTVITSFGAFGATLNHDILGRSKGTTFAVNYSVAQTFDKLTVMPSIGLTWQDRRYNNYYYGITEAESKRSGLAQYKSKQGINPYIELNLSYQATPKWQIMGTARYDHLNKQIRRSPMVNRNNLYSLQLGFAYQF